MIMQTAQITSNRI